MKTKTEIFIILNYMRTNSYKVGNKNECKLSLRKTIEGARYQWAVMDQQLARGPSVQPK